MCIRNEQWQIAISIGKLEFISRGKRLRCPGRLGSITKDAANVAAATYSILLLLLHTRQIFGCFFSVIFGACVFFYLFVCFVVAWIFLSGFGVFECNGMDTGMSNGVRLHSPHLKDADIVSADSLNNMVVAFFRNRV